MILRVAEVRYLADEVGLLAGVSGTTIGQWARRGLIRSSASAGPPRVYAFDDVREAQAVAELLGRGLAHAEIRRLIAALAPEHGDWPLAGAGLAVPAGARGGRAPVFARRDGALVAVGRDGGQAAIALPDLQAVGAALRGRGVALQRDRLSGRPTVAGRRISARMVAETAGTAVGRRVLGADYGLPAEAIAAARRWWRRRAGWEATA